MSYLEKLKKEANKTETENNAATNKSTLNPVLDFFSQGGAMRGRMDDAATLFAKAYNDDPLLALKSLFYIRDIREGQGERDIFRKCIQEVPGEAIKKNIEHIPEFGRWDDLFVLDPDLYIGLIKKQLQEDLKALDNDESVSLLAKWMPSENASSEETKHLARRLMEKLEMSPKEYRKTLSKLRKEIGILERKMSENKWEEIDYEKVPSQALRKHTDAFRRHDEERFEEYMNDVESGDKSINTSTLYTYEVFDTVAKDPKAANAMWNNLPDYTRGENALVVADVSGSMTGRPMSISVSLALYFAERNEGTFNGYFMTFSEFPQLVEVQGDNLEDKLRFIEDADWDMNTDIEAAFRAILNAAIEDNSSQEEMPSTLYIISDMEFDRCAENGDMTNFENAKQMYKEAGYELPHVVFWQVDSRHNQTPAIEGDDNVTLISGASQTAFKLAVEGKTPEESMKEVLNSERYQVINL